MKHVRSEKCSHQPLCWANHDRNIFILSTIQTTSQGSFNHDQMIRSKWRTCGEEASAKRSEFGPTTVYETKCLVKIWANV